MNALPRLGLALLLLLTAHAVAQEAVLVGKGAYASFPPTGIAKGKAEEAEKQPVFLLNEDGRPIPSNKWYESLILSRYGQGLWPLPLKVDTNGQGIHIFYPTQWKPDGSDLVTENPLRISAKDFVPTGTLAKDWSDWLVSFRLLQTPERFFDVTLGQGMPYVWMECHGVEPTLSWNGAANFFDLTGTAITLPATGDALGIECSGHRFGVFAPEGTKFQPDGSGINITFSGTNQFLVICPLPATKDIQYFHRYAFAIPRDTKLSWKYAPEQGSLTTNWKVTTQPLKGAETQIIQGWLPHHYRTTKNNLAFNSLEYMTGRGKMRCAVGNEFTLTYPFNGILPNLPPPKAIGGPHDYDPARLNALLDQVVEKPKFAGDTYWGGKDLVRFTQAALMGQLTNSPSYPKALEAVRAELINWFSYQPGKPDHFFAFYPRNKALVGFNPSFGSEHFTDNHFHYGYFTFASGMLAMNDPGFVADYGQMARLVAKTYANWERNDNRFPFFRTFDIWAGHSWAGGSGSKNGTNNQESTSEAVQSWSGLILLGQALADKEMVAAGVMGYCAETQAAMEYWFDAHNDVFPPEWKHPIAGIIWSSGKVWGTWFSGSPSWIYGIQWCPSSQAASYLVRDPAWARRTYETMCKEFTASEERNAAKKPGYQPKPAVLKSWGGDLGTYLLGFVLMYDPQWAAEQLDELLTSSDEKQIHNVWLAHVYYMAQSMRTLGTIDWNCHGSSATSLVYFNSVTKTHSYVVWNPLPKPATVQFYEGSKRLGQMTADPQSITSITHLK